MTVTISRVYNSYPDAEAAINALEASGVKHGDISVLASNADEWYKGNSAKPGTFPDRNLNNKDDRAEAAILPADATSERSPWQAANGSCFGAALHISSWIALEEASNP